MTDERERGGLLGGVSAGSGRWIPEPEFGHRCVCGVMPCAAIAASVRRESAEREAGLLLALRRAWEDVGRCEDEFMPEQPEACSEYRDRLDTAIVNLLALAPSPGTEEGGA